MTSVCRCVRACVGEYVKERKKDLENVGSLKMRACVLGKQRETRARRSCDQSITRACQIPVLKTLPPIHATYFEDTTSSTHLSQCHSC